MTYTMKRMMAIHPKDVKYCLRVAPRLLSTSSA